MDLAAEEHLELEKILNEFHDLQLHKLRANSTTKLNSVFTHEPALFTSKGVVILQPPTRRAEAPAMLEHLVEIGYKIIGQLSMTAHCDGGDLMWMDDKTLIAGRTFRTNAKGVEELKSILHPLGITVIEVHLPCHLHVLHLHSLVSMLDDHIAVGYKQLLPVPLIELFMERNVKLIEVPEDEFISGAANVLAFEPKNVLIMTGNPKTKEEMEKSGIKVREWKGDELCKKGGGGPKCLINGELWTHYR